MSSDSLNNMRPLIFWLNKNGFAKEASALNKVYKVRKYAASSAEINRLKQWMDSGDSELSFDKLFGGKLRVIIPFSTQEQKQLVEIISLLKNLGWEPSGGNNFFDVKKVKQKLRALDTGEEYEEEVQVADLKISKKEVRVIPKGPKKGEEIVSKSTSTISKVLATPKTNAPSWMVEWWRSKQAEYVKNFNWNQIESIFKEGQLSSEHSIIISRDPIDVLRMSDHQNITSCHAEGKSYFECAIYESRGNGIIAYLVKTSDVSSLTDGGVEFNDLDNQEIFSDPQRDVEGIIPKSRIRLRKYVDIELGYEFAVPEHRAYGPSIPGFKDLVRSWAWNEQKELFELEDGRVQFNLYDLEMHGGSHRDTSDGEILNAFFREGGIETDFHGDAENISEDEESIMDFWSEELRQIGERADAELEHASFYTSIEDSGEGQPIISAAATLYCKIQLSGWKEISFEDRNFAEAKGFKRIPIGYGGLMR